MSFNSMRDELFLADKNANAVHSLRLPVKESIPDLQKITRSPTQRKSHSWNEEVWSACHIADTDTLLVCVGKWAPQFGKWLLAMRRKDSEWVKTEFRVETKGLGNIICPLNDAQVLIGQRDSTYMELFRVDSDSRINRVHRIHLSEVFSAFAATYGYGSDILVALSNREDRSVRLHRLRGDRFAFEELSRVQLKLPDHLLWFNQHLLVTDWVEETHSHAISVLDVNGLRLGKCRELIPYTTRVNVSSWVVVPDGLAIFDCNARELQFYSS